MSFFQNVAPKKFVRQRGFTMVELLVVTAILGILAGLGIVNFGAYKKSSYDSQAESAVRAVAEAEEAYYVDAEHYVACDQSDCHLLLEGLDAIDSDISINVTLPVGGGFEIAGSNQRGSGKTYHWP